MSQKKHDMNDICTIEKVCVNKKGRMYFIVFSIMLEKKPYGN